jgi:glutathione synthase/RimK-type ligase-like ATP-grasp enzyme
VINLADDCSYMSVGYYCSLLAEARGERVIPSVETILDLSRKSLYEMALPELDAVLQKDITRQANPPKASFTLTICFGAVPNTGFRNLARLVFDRFRCPLLRVSVQKEGDWRIKTIEMIAPKQLSPEEFDFFQNALHGYSRIGWQAPKRRKSLRYSLAVLVNPDEALPPSDPRALKQFQKAGAAEGIEVEMITRKDFLRLAEYDALFIRETTSIKDHTFRFAKKAEAEGMPVIDDPTSILRCTNKVYLAELLSKNGIPAPKTMIVDREHLDTLVEGLGFPMVLKIPDGSFSRGVHKAENKEELTAYARKLFKTTDVILAQEFMYTEYDWRIGILNRQPIYAAQYFMSRAHWQIYKHGDGGKTDSGDSRTLPVEEAPQEVVEAALKAANLIGDGLYGVDMKQNSRGAFVIEVNDNPNIDRGIEDAYLKDELYLMLMRDFKRRIEDR